jgi:hypothetical protein
LGSAPAGYDHLQEGVDHTAIVTASLGIIPPCASAAIGVHGNSDQTDAPQVGPRFPGAIE